MSHSGRTTCDARHMRRATRFSHIRVHSHPTTFETHHIRQANVRECTRMCSIHNVLGRACARSRMCSVGNVMKVVECGECSGSFKNVVCDEWSRMFAKVLRECTENVRRVNVECACAECDEKVRDVRMCHDVKVLACTQNVLRMCAHVSECTVSYRNVLGQNAPTFWAKRTPHPGSPRPTLTSAEHGPSSHLVACGSPLLL